MDSVEDMRNAGSVEREAGGADHDVPPAGREHHWHGGSRARDAAAIAGVDSAVDHIWMSCWTGRRRFAHRWPMCEITLVISVVLVILVVFAFSAQCVGDGDSRASRCRCRWSGTFGVMYLLGYTLDNLSLMALTISTGFVVDDAIVVIENITRYLEQGMTPVEAASAGCERNRIHGAVDEHVADRGIHSDFADGRDCRAAVSRVRGDAERGGREFRMVVSLTTTPMMCAKFLKHRVDDRKHGLAVPR